MTEPTIFPLGLRFSYQMEYDCEVAKPVSPFMIFGMGALTTSRMVFLSSLESFGIEEQELNTSICKTYKKNMIVTLMSDFGNFLFFNF